jgi:acyl-CoA thioesterase FadM
VPWVHEMRRGSDQTLLARAHSTGAFANRKGHPVRLPDEYLLSVLHGGAKERVRK